MEVKVQCQCGGRFAFEVEPVNGRMPCSIMCPQCGVEATQAANGVIAKNLAAAAGPAPVGVPSGGGLRVTRSHSHPVAASGDAEPAPAGEVQYCARHHRTPVESKCHVCGKPICRDCMTVFGYLCSAQCRYKAEQEKIKVPVCAFQKSVSDAKQWRKVGAIAGVIGLIVAGLLGFYAWYAFVGSHPSLAHSWSASDKEPPALARFLDPGHVLLVDSKQAVLRDLAAGREVWKTALPKDDARRYSYAAPRVHITPADIWLCTATSVLRLNRQNGSVVTTIPIPGDLHDCKIEGSSLVAISSPAPNQQRVLRVDLATGATKFEEVALTPVKKKTAQNDGPDASAATQGALLNAEFNETIRFDQSRDQVIAGSTETLELLVQLVEQRLVEVKSIKPKGESIINDKLSVSTSSTSVAEEVFNDIKRSRSGGTKKIDESRYGITVRRLSGREWRGEVNGPPGFFPLKTVDVLSGGKKLIVLDKQGKVLFDTKLAYPMAESYASSRANGAGPCLEGDGALYFFDQGVLTAFDLPGGTVRWKVESVGVSSVTPDGHGALYVCTTTAAAEDIQYSDQIKMGNKTRPQLLKVDAKTGKIWWAAQNTGQSCFLVGKYLYACNHWVSGPGLTTGLSEALGSRLEISGNFILTRINPSSGREVWYHTHTGAPDSIDFSENKIMLVFDSQVQVLKFFAF